MINKKNYILSVLLFCGVININICYAAKLLLSDPQDKTQSFTFDIGAHAYYIPEGTFFVGAKDAIFGNKFAVSSVMRGQKIFTPLTPQIVNLDNKPDQINPLHGAAISNIAILDFRTLVIKKDDSILYLIDNSLHASNKKEKIDVYRSSYLGNSKKKNIKHPRILAVATSQPTISAQNANNDEQAPKVPAIFAAVANSKDRFDGNGAGIALAFFRSETVDNKTYHFFDVVNAQTGDSEFIEEKKEIVKLPQINENELNNTDKEKNKNKDKENTHKKTNKKTKNNESDKSNAMKPDTKNDSQQVAKDDDDKKNDANNQKNPNSDEKGVFEKKLSYKGNVAFPIGLNMAELKIGGALAAIRNAVDLFYDPDFERLYVALDVKAGPKKNDGARAIVAFAIMNNKLIPIDIAPTTAFNSDKIIGGLGASSEIAIHKVRTMQTRTYLRYLVVVASSDHARGKRNVFALPLVFNKSSDAHGKLAKVTSIPVDAFSKVYPYSFDNRAYVEPAVSPKDLYDANSIAARIGGKTELPGDITDINVVNDTIFVSVAQNGNLKAGIFFSQALFDSEGRISSWTNWQRALADQKINGFAYDPYLGTFNYIPAVTKKNAGKNVLRTRWSRGRTSFEKFISNKFPKAEGGVQGLFNFPENTPSFSKEIGSRLSLLVLTGYQKVFLFQTGKDHNGSFGSIKEIDLKNMGITKKDDALKEIGPITSAAILSDGTNGWLAVGGSGGLAILAKADGTGWDAVSGLRDGLKDIDYSLLFKSVGNFKNIRKLSSIDNHLYVLTPSTVNRIELTAQAIMNNSLMPVVLAKAKSELLTCESSFSDMIISPPLALLATSDGLLRSGNGINIANIENEKSANWTVVNLPESMPDQSMQGPVTRMYAISRTGFEYDVSKGGNVYILNACVSTLQAQVYRFSLNVGDAVTDDSVAIFPDFFVNDLRSYFVNLGDYRNYVVTDGAIIAATRSGYGKSNSILEYLPPTLKSGQIFNVQKSLSMVFLTNKTDTDHSEDDVRPKADLSRSVGQMIRNSANGNWLLPGDFGLRTQS